MAHGLWSTDPFWLTLCIQYIKIIKNPAFWNTSPPKIPFLLSEIPKFPLILTICDNQRHILTVHINRSCLVEQA